MHNGFSLVLSALFDPEAVLSAVITCVKFAQDKAPPCPVMEKEGTHEALWAANICWGREFSFINMATEK